MKPDEKQTAPERIWINPKNRRWKWTDYEFTNGVEYRLARDVEVDVRALAQQKLNDAVMYALREGCFFPVPEPQRGATTKELIQWGAMRNLHDAIAEFNRADLGSAELPQAAKHLKKEE